MGNSIWGQDEGGGHRPPPATPSPPSLQLTHALHLHRPARVHAQLNITGYLGMEEGLMQREESFHQWFKNVLWRNTSQREKSWQRTQQAGATPAIHAQAAHPAAGTWQVLPAGPAAGRPWHHPCPGSEGVRAALLLMRHSRRTVVAASSRTLLVIHHGAATQHRAQIMPRSQGHQKRHFQLVLSLSAPQPEILPVWLQLPWLPGAHSSIAGPSLCTQLLPKGPANLALAAGGISLKYTVGMA